MVLGEPSFKSNGQSKLLLGPRALHGISAVCLGLKHFGGLRTEYMTALRFSKPGANPMIQCLLDGFDIDPQVYSIWRTILDFRVLGGADSHQVLSLDLVGREGVSAAQATISEVLCQRVHQLGWTYVGQGQVCDEVGTFSLLSDDLLSVKHRLSWAWLKVVAEHVAPRMDFHHFDCVHVDATRNGIRKYPLADQGALRAVLNGTTFTNRHAYHWSDDGSLGCPECGQDDSLHHKYWLCPFVQDLIQKVSPEVIWSY